MKNKCIAVLTLLVITTMIALPFSGIQKAVAAEPFAPEISIDPTSFDVTQPVNTVTDETLSITNNGDEPLDWSFLPLGGWADNFDSYETDSSMHGQGGWKGWSNDPAATAYTRDIYSRSAPNSVEIISTSDLVHEYAVDSGVWTYTAWQYIPTGYSGQTYFIMLNQYDDAGVTNNWSVQVFFDSATNLVTNFGLTGGTLPIVYDQWVQIQLLIDLDADIQTFYYGGDELYSGTWTNEQGSAGITSIGAVDLFGNLASPVYYDDLSLTPPAPAQCDLPGDQPWLDVSPMAGTIPLTGTVPVTVTFDTNVVGVGTYNANLCVFSNDPISPTIELPVMLTVFQPEPDILVVPTVITQTVEMSGTAEAVVMISNVGTADLDVTDVTITSTLGTPTWLTVPFTQTTVAVGASVPMSLTFDTTGLMTGTYTATITILSNDPDEPMVDIGVTLIVVEPTVETWIQYLPLVMKGQ